MIISFPEFAEFSESDTPFRKNSICVNMFCDPMKQCREGSVRNQLIRTEGIEVEIAFELKFKFCLKKGKKKGQWNKIISFCYNDQRY